jgi:hypothetical protein
MKRWQIIVLINLFFLVLVAIFTRYIIFSPSNAIVTHHLATDLYGHFMHVWERIQMLKQHFLPLGDYWMNLGGGYPAASNDQLIAQHEFLMMIIYIFTGSFAIAMKILIPLFYLATVITSYWYGSIVFKKRSMSIIFAVAYTFCTYGINQLEHLELVGVQPFIMLALIYLEKVFNNPKRLSNQLLSSVFIVLIYLSNLYALYFVMVYLVFRYGYYIITTKNRAESLKSMIIIGTISLLLIIPHFLPQLAGLPSNTVKVNLGNNITDYSRTSGFYFMRNYPYVPYVTETYTMYLGISVIILAVLPMCLKRKPNWFYILNMAITILFMVYSLGQYSHVNIAKFVHDHFPFAYFIEVPPRAMMIGCLCLSICAAFGFQELYERIKINWMKVGFTLLVAIIIFADLTIQLEPPTMPPYFHDNPTYDFIKKQSGDFRIIELSSIHDQQAMTEIYTGHDTISHILLGYGFFDQLKTFANVYNNYAKLQETAQDSAFYGIKYVILNLDTDYYSYFDKAIKNIGAPNYLEVLHLQMQIENDSNYKLVFKDGERYTYENLLYKGIVFGDNAEVQYNRANPDTINMVVNASENTNIVVSQCYAQGWTATITNDKGTYIEYPQNINDAQSLSVMAGVSTIKYKYINHSISLLNYVLYFLAVILIILALIFRRRFIYVAIAVYGLFVLVIFKEVNWYNSPSIYHLAVLGLGIVLFVGGLFTLYLRRDK